MRLQENAIATWPRSRIGVSTGLFWNEKLGCLYDVVNGGSPDPSIRPNQIFAVSLPHSMLPRDRARRVMEKVQEHLLTPFGLRTLSPEQPTIPRMLHRRSYRARWSLPPGNCLVVAAGTVHYRVCKGEWTKRGRPPSSANLVVSLRVSPCGSRVRPCLGNLRRRRAPSPLRMYCSGLERGRDSTCPLRRCKRSATEYAAKRPPDPEQDPGSHSRSPSSGASAQARLLRHPPCIPAYVWNKR